MALFTRSVGEGAPVVVVHGGPGTVDHTYLLPDLDRLAGVTVPTLVLHGDHDFVPPSAAERVAGSLPDARLVAIPNCGHCAYLEAMDAVYAEVASFLRG